MSSANPRPTVETHEGGNKRGLTEVVVESLRERILNWDYPPGHRLTEDQLCTEYGVSRSPVREALHRLETGGFIKRVPRRGYEVKQLDLRGVEELYELRLALELLVVERLCERDIAKPALDDLSRTWRGILNNPPASIDEMPGLDRQFHESLASAIDNEILLHELRSINDRLSIFRVLDFEISQRVESTCQEHLAILDRIANSDGEGARKAMRNNVDAGCNNVEAVIKEALAKAHGLNTRRMQ
jgi:DNA-binding GntR family transcriptional regulator